MHDETRRWWGERLTATGFFVAAWFVYFAMADLLHRALELDAVVLGLVWLVGAVLVLEKMRADWVRKWSEFCTAWAVAMPVVRATGANTETMSGAFAVFGMALVAFVLIGIPMKRWLARADAHRSAS